MRADAQLVLYGSSATPFALHHSDMDACLFLDHVKSRSSVVRRVARMLYRTEGIADVLPLPKARVPVVKFEDRST